MKGRTIPTKIVLIFRDLFIFYPSNHTTGELLFLFFSDKKQRLREFKEMPKSIKVYIGLK